jgi:hypothetical protein
MATLYVRAARLVLIGSLCAMVTGCEAGELAKETLADVFAPKTAAEGQEWVVGEWTAAARDEWADAETGYWEYFRFDSTGAGLWCMALGSDNTWGRCTPIRFSLKEERYTDTGEAYLRVALTEANGDFFLPGTALIISGGNLRVRRNGNTYPPFKRGNKHPYAPSP